VIPFRKVLRAVWIKLKVYSENKTPFMFSQIFNLNKPDRGVFMKKTLLILFILPFLLTTNTSFSGEVGCIKGDCENGAGVMSFHNGSKFEGEFKDGEYHGKGIFTFANGSTYKGEYKNGKYHGKGNFSYANGSKYEGEFKNSKHHGRGTFTFEKGAIYTAK
jgi:hypothetical protein